LPGINNSGVIAGYFGSGQKGHPNRGYALKSPYGQGSYRNENFPGSAQTQVTGINGMGDTVGFWVDGNGANHGFYEMKGHRAKTVDFPTSDNAKPPFDQKRERHRRLRHQLLGDDRGLAAALGRQGVPSRRPGAAMTQAFGVNDGDEVGRDRRQRHDLRLHLGAGLRLGDRQ
jgi:hypothetical protein